MAAPAPTTPSSVGSSQQTLSEWAGPYVTEMLGKTQAVADQPYQVYGGPQTAGESSLQSKVFQGLGNLSFPSNLGQSFASPMGGQQPQMQPQFNQFNTSSFGKIPAGLDDSNMGVGGGGMMDNLNANYAGSEMGAYNPAGGMQMGPITLGATQTGMPQQGGIGSLTPPQASQQPNNIAQSYMNPYLQSVLQPQMQELQRQSQMNLQPSMAKLTQAGGYGGGRQAIMESEANRNLLQEQNKTIGQGYSNAYDKAMGQFNTEQGQAKTLADMMSEAGNQQRGIEQQGISADYNEFLAQRDYPQKMLQFQQSMLQGLPISTVSNQPAQMSGLGSLNATVGGLGNLSEGLKNLGIKF